MPFLFLTPSSSWIYLLQAEAQLKQSLLRVVDPAGPAFRSLSNAFAASLLLHVLLGENGEVSATRGGISGGGSSSQSESEGPQGETAPVGELPRRVSVGAMSARLLGRVGGGIVAGDLAQLAGSLLALTGITEAVHLDTVYAPLCSMA